MMMRPWFMPRIWIALIIVPGVGFSQMVVEDSSQSNPNKSLVSTVADDVWHVASSPFRMSRNDALHFAAFLALNAGLVHVLDATADEEFALKGHQAYLKPAEGLADLGDLYNQIGPGRILAGLTTTMLASGIIFNDQKLLETTRLVIESSIITGFITTSSKGLFGRSRPYTEKGAHDFNFFKFSKAHKYLSFPSGHTSAIFAVTTVIAKQHDRWWIKYPAYTLAISVALQRMHGRQHWTSDVVVGGAIGYWVSNTLVRRHHGKARSQPFIPYFVANQIGVRINF